MFSRKNNPNPNTNYGGENTNPHTTSSYNEPNASSYGTGAGNTDSGRGPHKSSLLNKLDPRVDSTNGQQTSGTTRNDGGALGTSPRHENTGHGTGNTGYGTGHTGHGDNTGRGTGNTSYGSGITGRNTESINVGPHNSNLANKMDPRVDSDVDRTNTGMSRDSGYNTQHNSGYSNPTSGTGYGTSNTTSGPHTSNLANTADPRVDSDNSRSNYGNTTGNYSSPTGNHGSNTTGSGYGNTGSTTTGPHSSNSANKADPRIDSDNSKGNYGNITSPHNNPSTGTNYGTGHSESTNAGPHKSNLMNKLDPRVGSDMDGSRNVGMNNNQGMGISNTGTVPQEISSHGHATGPPAGALEGRHAKHTSGNVTNATASASVHGGMNPEGTANASGPTSADAGTTTSNQGGLKGAMKNMMGSDNNNYGDHSGVGHHQGQYTPTNRNY